MIRAERKGSEENHRKDQCSYNCFFEYIHHMDKPLARLIREKRVDSNQ